MFYDFPITIPAGTTETSPTRETLKLTHGIIHTVRIYFPPGPGGEVSLIILDGDNQVYPTNPSQQFKVDNVYIAFDDYYEMLSAPYELIAKGWSPNAAYDHTLRIEIGIIESKIALAGIKIALGLEKFLKLVGIKT